MCVTSSFLTHIVYRVLVVCYFVCFFYFFFNHTATTEIYTLSLHDALPILCEGSGQGQNSGLRNEIRDPDRVRSEEHTSELQSLTNLVCRLLLEKKKKTKKKQRQQQKNYRDTNKH